MLNYNNALLIYYELNYYWCLFKDLFILERFFNFESFDSESVKLRGRYLNKRIDPYNVCKF